MENLTFKEQIQAFYSSDIVLSPHGSALVNLLFSIPHSAIIECNPPYYLEAWYTNTALMSAINGLGKTLFTFLINVTGLLVRISGVFLAIPRFGIRGYLWGLLASQFVVTGLAAAVLLASARPSRPRHSPGPRV